MKTVAIETLERRALLSSAPAFTGAVTVPGALNDYSDTFASVKVTPDGKIVAVGRTQPQPFLLSQWAVFEFNADGSLNTSFGVNGAAANPFAGATTASAASTLKIVNDDNDSGYTLLVGGSETVVNLHAPKKNNENFALARYTSDGQLDTTFNGTGFVAADLGSLADNLNSLLINADGSILASGTASVRGKNEPAVVKLNSDGTFNLQFGGNGTEIYSFDRGASGAELQPVTGSATGFYLIAFGSNIFVAKCDDSGALDPTFGATMRHGIRVGFTKLPHLPGGTNSLFSVNASDPSGLELAVAGSSPVGVSKVAFDKLTTLGTPDTSFGRRNGQILARLNYPDRAAPHGAIFNADGSIFTFGYTYALSLHVKMTDVVYQQYTIVNGTAVADPNFDAGVPIVQSVIGNTRFNAFAMEPGVGLNGGDAYVFAGDLDVPKMPGSIERHILALYRIFANGQTDPSFIG